jgi:hypothetical protein
MDEGDYQRRWTGGEVSHSSIYILHGNVEGERSRGCQRKTWMDNIKEDIEESNMDMRNAYGKHGYHQGQSSVETPCKGLIVGTTGRRRTMMIETCSLLLQYMLTLEDFSGNSSQGIYNYTCN